MNFYDLRVGKIVFRNRNFVEKSFWYKNRSEYHSVPFNLTQFCYLIFNFWSRSRSRTSKVSVSEDQSGLGLERSRIRSRSRQVRSRLQH